MDDSVYTSYRRDINRDVRGTGSIEYRCGAFIARLVENSLLEIPNGLIEAARAMGANAKQVIFKVLLPEALPSLVNNATITLITLVGYSAMGGAVGAGGLGQIGYQYGYVGYDTFIMNSVLILLILIVFLLQYTGDYISKKVNHR